MRKIILTVLFILLLFLDIQAQRILNLQTGLTSYEVTNTCPSRNINDTNDSVVVTYEFNKIIILDDSLFSGRHVLKIDGFGLTTETRSPMLPVRWDSFTIPTGANIQITVIDSSYIDINIELVPAYPVITNNSGYSSSDSIPEIIPYSGFYPHSVLMDTTINKCRKDSILRLCVCPVKYDYANKIARIYKKIAYKISYSSNLIEDSTGLDSLENNPLLNNSIINRRHIKSNYSTQNLQKKDYLIISVPKHSEAVEKFAEWKRTLGYNVHVLYKSNWPVDTIKKRVKDMYDNTDNLEYLLIIGDKRDVAGEWKTAQTSSMNSHMTDLYYGCMDGEEDYIPEIYRGRLLVYTSSESNLIVDKIINYERNPVLDKSFYSNALHVAGFNDENQDGYEDLRNVLTSEEIRNGVMLNGKNIERQYGIKPENSEPLNWSKFAGLSNGDSIPYELHKPGFAWDGKLLSIISGINNGSFYVLYSGHGNNEGWQCPYVNKVFLSSSYFHNERKLPIVFSFACQTGKYSINSNFASEFMKIPTGGCVAIYAASEIIFGGLSDSMAEGMFDAIWPQSGIIPTFPNKPEATTFVSKPMYELGQILEQGLLRMEETWGYKDDIYNKYMRETMHCFGDPSMMIYTNVPSVFKNVNIQRTEDCINVSLSDSAKISFYNRNTNEVFYFLGSSVVFNGNPDNIVVCISAHNKIPYIDDPQNNTLYIQNESVNSSKTFNSINIKAGSNVTNSKPSGPVVFSDGKISLIGRKVEIEGNTSVERGVEFEILPH